MMEDAARAEIPEHRLGQLSNEDQQEEVTVNTSSHKGSIACKIGLVCLFVAGGIGFFVVYQTFFKGNSTGGLHSVNSVSHDGEYVQVDFEAGFPEEFKDSFWQAAKRWSDVLNTTTLVPEDITKPTGEAYSYVDLGCSVIADKTIPRLQLNHLLIYAEVADIDGPSGVLGSAGPCSWFGITEGSPEVFTSGTRILPTLGSMRFDSADIQGLMDDGTLEDTILHEMGHVLGIGTMWDALFTSGTNQLYELNHLRNPIFSYRGNSVIVRPENTPSFSGPAALVEYSHLRGSSSEFHVPVEDGRDTEGVQKYDVIRGEGMGTIDGHWKQAVFGDELMTGFLTGSENPMSKLTIMSLQDIGYNVNPQLADDYILGGRRRLNGGRKNNSGASTDEIIRHSRQDWEEAFEKWKKFHRTGRL